MISTQIDSFFDQQDARLVSSFPRAIQMSRYGVGVRQLTPEEAMELTKDFDKGNTRAHMTEKQLEREREYKRAYEQRAKHECAYDGCDTLVDRKAKHCRKHARVVARMHGSAVR